MLSICLVVVNIRYASLIFLIAVTLIPSGVHYDIGGFNLYPLRIMIIFGFARMLIRSEYFKTTRSDYIISLFVPICLFSSFFHDDPSAAFIYRAGLGLDTIGAYVLFRSWISNIEDFKRFFKTNIYLYIVILPLMTYENAIGHNLFSYIGGVPFIPWLREGHYRAQGPFIHAILAGTIAGACMPMAIALWNENRILAKFGMVATLVIPLQTVSSGPILTVLIAAFGLTLWYKRQYLKIIIKTSIYMLICLHIIMKAPVWFLIARIDFTGGSTSWHRAELIDSSIRHISEWWFAGTDYTRHWMPTGVSWSLKHSDITNRYIWMGVIGGLPLMISFISLFIITFKCISRALSELDEGELKSKFLLWTAGSVVFAHCVSMLAVGYHDQSAGLFYTQIGATISLTNYLTNENKGSFE